MEFFEIYSYLHKSATVPIWRVVPTVHVHTLQNIHKNYVFFEKIVILWIKPTSLCVLKPYLFRQMLDTMSIYFIKVPTFKKRHYVQKIYFYSVIKV